jgi:Rrf2 family protein
VLRLTKKSEYGLMALAYMAGSNHSTSAKDIVKELNMPRRLLTEVLKELSKEKVVTGTPGPGGGYKLQRPATEITLGEIVEVLEGPLSLVSCDGGGDCDRTPSCTIKSGVNKIADDIRGVLSSATLAEVAAGDSMHKSLFDAFKV